jgi:hypothetical protein
MWPTELASVGLISKTSCAAAEALARRSPRELRDFLVDGARTVGMWSQVVCGHSRSHVNGDAVNAPASFMRAGSN